VGSVGLTEAEARHKHGQIDVYRSVFRPMRTLFAGGGERMLMKIVAEPGEGRVLGCHIVGPDAPEMIQLAAVAVKAGLTKRQWDATCALHPTVAEELVTMRDRYLPQGLSAAE
jgi:glutathione reductase (NADPH)